MDPNNVRRDDIVRQALEWHRTHPNGADNSEFHKLFFFNFNLRQSKALLFYLASLDNLVK
jgi:hypothetical protein